MYLTEQFTLYNIAHKLVFDEGYDVLHINDKDQEVWLEKYENKTSKVIRLLHKGFNWKNHLKTDVARVFQRTKAMKQLLLGKTIEIYNVYVSSHAPVDQWESLKKPLQLNEKNPPKMKVYYLSESNFDEELSRLQADIGTTFFDRSVEQSEAEAEEAIERYQIQLSKALHDKIMEVENVLSFGKPFLTYFLILINIIMFIILETNGGSTDIPNLINFGAKYNPAIVEGEWWRIISSMFLHIGYLHLFMNMLALYYLGVAVERIYGSWRFIIIYFLAGIGGGLTSFAFSMSISAGASGAIFGLFGALLFFGSIHKKIFLQTMGKGILTIIVINIVIGFTIPEIDVGAHLGGLLAGFLGSAVLHLPRNKNRLMQVLAFFLYVALLFGLVTYGTEVTVNSTAYQLIKIEESLKDNNYEEVVIRTTTALKNPDEFKAELLFHRSYAYIHLNNNELAIKDLEESIDIKTDFAEAYYNLTTLYAAQGETNKAIDAATKAYELNPKSDDYINLYEKITGKKLD